MWHKIFRREFLFCLISRLPKKFLEHFVYLIPLPVPVYSLENVEIKYETYRENKFEETQNMEKSLKPNKKENSHVIFN